jgi:zinc protease
MTSNRLSLSLATLAFTLMGCPKATGPERPSMGLQLDDYSLNTYDYCFASGLRVLLQEDHTQPIVSVTEVIDRGSDADPVGKEGIAHLVEHLWFRSFEDENTPKVWDMLDEMGTQLNAFTSADVTAYMTITPSNSLRDVLQLEARRLMGAESVNGVVPQDVSIETEVVRNELRMRTENTAGMGFHYVYGKLYPEGHPYHRLTIGTHDSLDSITLEDVQQFTEDNYRPENATLMVVGDFTPEEIGPMLQEAFPIELLRGDVPEDAPLVDQSYCQARVAPEIIEPPEPVDREISYHRAGVEKRTAIIAWALPGGYRPEEPLMSITANMLTTAVATYLNPDFDPMTDSLDSLNNVGCGLNAEEHASTVTCFIEMADSADAEDVIEKAVDGLYQMWNINNRYWQRYVFSDAKNQQMAGIFRSVEEVASLFSARATSSALFTHFTGNGQYFGTNFEWLRGVDEGQAAQLAERYLNRDRYVAVVLEPYGEDDITIDSSDASYVGRPFEGTNNTMIDLDSVDQELLASLTMVPNLEELQDYTIENGMRVIMLPYGTAPVARAYMTFEGGDLHEPQLGLETFSLQFTDFYPAGDGNAPLRLAGAWLGGFGPTSVGLGIEGSSANIESQLYLLRARLQGLDVRVSAKGDFFDSLQSSVNRNRRYPEYWESVITDRRMFPEHPLSQTIDEQYIEAMGSFGRADIEDWLNAVYRPENATLYIIGRFDGVATQALVDTYFADWAVEAPLTHQLTELESPTTLPERQVIIFNKNLVSQTNVSLSCMVEPRSEENVQTHAVLGSVLSEMAWNALREQSGVTYGAGSGVGVKGETTATLRFNSLVQNDAAALAVSTFLDLPRQIQTGEFDQSLIPLMQVSTARQYVIGQQTTAQMMGRLAAVADSGYGWDYFTDFPARLAAVDLEALQGEMDRCVGHEIVTLLGPSDVIGPHLENAGIEYEVFDYEAETDRLWAERDPSGWEDELERRAESDEE